MSDDTDHSVSDDTDHSAGSSSHHTYRSAVPGPRFASATASQQ